MDKKFAEYRGRKYEVVHEDADGKWMTIDRGGYKSRHLREDLVLEEPKEDVLAKELSDKPLLKEIPSKPLPKEIPDKGFAPLQNDVKGIPQEVLLQHAQKIQETAPVDPKKIQQQQQKVVDAKLKAASENEKMAQLQKQAANVDAQNTKSQQQTPVNTITGTKLEETVPPNMMNVPVGINTSVESNKERQHINQDTIDHSIITKIKEGLQSLLKTLDESNEENPEETLEEDCAGVASAAAPGAPDGATNEPGAVQGIAQFNGRLGIGVQRRKKIEESFITLGEFKLEESKFSNISRHLVADRVEESIEPLTEGECSPALRRKVRIESIGRHATSRECAKFIAENKFVPSEGKYVPRETKLDESAILEKMKKMNETLLNKIHKS